MHLTLLVPELLWPEPADQLTLGKLSLPGLETLLARARLERRPPRPFEHSLAAVFGLDPAPFGALRLWGEADAQTPTGHWLCADPVHLRFHHERIVLADAGAFDLTLNEAREIVDALNREFADIGRFHVADARRWYLQLNVAVDHAAAPISAVAGRRVDGESGGGTQTLTRWLNEVQMYLHGLPTNMRRQESGQPAVNSLWLWGGGALPSGAPRNFSAVYAESPLASGLARLTGQEAQPLPAALAQLSPQAGANPLVVLDNLLPRVLYEDGEGWREAIAQLESGWFAPLARGSAVSRLTLLAPTVYGELHYEMTGGDRWKLWKRGKPLAEIAHTLANA